MASHSSYLKRLVTNILLSPMLLKHLISAKADLCTFVCNYKRRKINIFGIINRIKHFFLVILVAISLALGLHKSQYCSERRVLFCKYDPTTALSLS